MLFPVPMRFRILSSDFGLPGPSAFRQSPAFLALPTFNTCCHLFLS